MTENHLNGISIDKTAPEAVSLFKECIDDCVKDNPSTNPDVIDFLNECLDDLNADESVVEKALVAPVKKKRKPKKSNKMSFFDLDNHIFQDKNRWIDFVGFSKRLQKDLKAKYEMEIRGFWADYKLEHSTPVIPWIDTTSLRDCQEKVREDKDRSHTSCFRNIKINKSPLQIKNFDGFDLLEKEFPNFKEVIQLYKGFFVLNASRHVKNYQAPRPLLLLGNPGIGKTRFAKRLAQVLGTDYKFLDSNSITSGAILTGHNASWRGADAGFIFKTLAPCSNLSPVLLLDEVDKLSSNRDYSPFSTFHQLLEPENSVNLYDEFLELEFNGSFIIYILTANEVRDIPESLLSRMNVVDIKNPDKEQMKIISQNIFTELLAGSKLFNPQLSDSMLENLSKLSPREVYQVLSKNLFNLSAIQKKKQNNEFVFELDKKREHKIGF